MSNQRKETHHEKAAIIRAYLGKIGSKGGKATGPKKARTSEQARRAALVRWGKKK